jgi:hypothetical protein
MSMLYSTWSLPERSTLQDSTLRVGYRTFLKILGLKDTDKSKVQYIIITAVKVL